MPTVVKSKKDILTIVIGIIWICVLFMRFNLINNFIAHKNYSIVFYGIFYFITCYLFYIVIWSLLGKQVFSVSGSFFIIESKVLFFKVTRQFSIDKISHVRISQEIDGSTFLGSTIYSTWGFQGVQFPAKTRPFVCFDYDGKKVIIGQNLLEFNLEEFEKFLTAHLHNIAIKKNN